MKKLYKSNRDKVFSGVIGGLGEYFDLDPTILRIGYILLTVLTGIFPALIAYIIMSLIVPEQPRTHYADKTSSEMER